MMNFAHYFVKFIFIAIVFQIYPASAQNAATQTAGLNEEIVSVDFKWG